MKKFATTCLSGTIPSHIESYSDAILGKKEAPRKLSKNYVSGSLLDVDVAKNYPDILRAHVLEPHMKLAFETRPTPFGTEISKHGYFQRNVSDTASCIYAMDSILPLINPFTDENSLVLIMTSTIKGLMDRLCRSLYGIGTHEETFHHVFALRHDAALLDSRVREKLKSVPLESKSESFAIKRIPNIHEIFRTQRESLSNLLQKLLKKHGRLSGTQWTLCMQRVWSCFVVLWRASEGLSKSTADRYHESLLATRYCEQVSRDILEYEEMADCISKQNKILSKYATDVLCFDVTSCPLKQ